MLRAARAPHIRVIAWRPSSAARTHVFIPLSSLIASRSLAGKWWLYGQHSLMYSNPYIHGNRASLFPYNLVPTVFFRSFQHFAVPFDLQAFSLCWLDILCDVEEMLFSTLCLWTSDENRLLSSEPNRFEWNVWPILEMWGLNSDCVEHSAIGLNTAGL